MSNAENFSEILKNCRAEEYNSNIPPDVHKEKDFKLVLLEIRKYFLEHNTIYIGVKVFIGILLLGLPVFLTKILINSKNTVENNSLNSNYTIVAWPLIFPTWERISTGILIQALIFIVAIYFFVLNFIECLEYLDTLKGTLLREVYSKDVITSTTAKILLFNIFDEKVIGQGQYDIGSSKASMNITIPDMMRNRSYLKRITLFGYNRELLVSSSVQDDAKEYLVIGILIKLYRPIVFICYFTLIKIIFFTSKNIWIYSVLILSALFEYYSIQVSSRDGKENHSNIIEIFPVYLFLGFYLLLVLKNIYKFHQKYSHPAYNEIKKEITRFVHYSTLDKFIIITLDILLACSLINLIIAFSLCTSNENVNHLLLNDHKRIIENEKMFSHEVRILAKTGVILFIIGNLYKIGNLVCYLVFFPIEKEYFPADIADHVIRVKPNLRFIKACYYSEMNKKMMMSEIPNENDPCLYNSPTP